MAENISMNSRRELAKMLYLSDYGITQKEIASRVEVSEKTIGKWIKEEQWEKQRTSLLMTKSAELTRMYAQLSELNSFIEGKPEGQRYGNSKEADVMVKLTSAIKSLEQETNAADAMEVCKNLINLVRKEDTEIAKVITKWADVYIKSLMK